MSLTAIYAISVPLCGDGSTTSFSVNLNELPDAAWATPNNGLGIPNNLAPLT